MAILSLFLCLPFNFLPILSIKTQNKRRFQINVNYKVFVHVSATRKLLKRLSPLVFLSVDESRPVNARLMQLFALFLRACNDFFAPHNNCFACIFFTGMLNVRRLELEKETQNEPIEMNCVLGVLFDFF